MSAEGKKKRGESGRVKALTEPYRLNGRAPDWWARDRGVYAVPAQSSGGSTTMRGIVGGALAERMGFRMPDLPLLDNKYDHAQSRVTHPMLKEASEPVPRRRAA